MTACVKFKSLVENKKTKLFSKPLISELKNFVASGVGFKGKNEESDDLVSATLLICRMASVLADWDPSVYQFMSEREEEDIMPLPIFISNYIG
jgi:hypothetical protein